MRVPDKAVWIKSLANDLGRLARGVGSCMPTGTNTLYFFHLSQIPPDCKVTYAKLVATLQPQKEEEHRVRVTVGRYKLDYPGITANDTASISTLKLILNSVISTPLARFLNLYINNSYYNTPMSRYEYMRIPLSLIQDKIVAQYDLCQLSKDGWVYT